MRSTDYWPKFDSNLSQSVDDTNKPQGQTSTNASQPQGGFGLVEGGQGGFVRSSGFVDHGRAAKRGATADAIGASGYGDDYELLIMMRISHSLLHLGRDQTRPRQSGVAGPGLGIDGRDVTPGRFGRAPPVLRALLFLSFFFSLIIRTSLHSPPAATAAAAISRLDFEFNVSAGAEARVFRGVEEEIQLVHVSPVSSPWQKE